MVWLEAWVGRKDERGGGVHVNLSAEMDGTRHE